MSKLQTEEQREEEEFKKALEESARCDRESKMSMKSRELEEEEMLMAAIQASQQEEMDR
jgi:hypothetical protein